MKFSAETLAQYARGQLLRGGPEGVIETDTRKLGPGSWFLALVGERFDAHDFLHHAADKGCAGAIVSRVPEGTWECGLIVVEDTLVALQDMARGVRKSLACPVVGITGSVGKTTTRALVGCALSSLGEVHQTAGNYNNHIGLPLTLLAAPEDPAAVVLEMGMSGPGEIELLQAISRPHVRLITRITAAHLEGVGSIEGVAAAKGELFDGPHPGDVLIVNADDPRVLNLPRPSRVRVLSYGSKQGCDVRLHRVDLDSDDLTTRLMIEVGSQSYTIRLASPGRHLASNACAAIAVALALGVPVEAAVSGVEAYRPVGMRMRVESGPYGTTVLNDAYNANPASTAAALAVLTELVGRPRVALLGDMLELGDDAVELHRESLALALCAGLDVVGVCGAHFVEAAEGLRSRDPNAVPRLLVAPDAESLASALPVEVLHDAVVLLKGSRGMAMERILQVLGGED